MAAGQGQAHGARVLLFAVMAALAVIAGCGSQSSGTAGSTAQDSTQANYPPGETLRALADRREFQFGASPLMSPYKDARSNAILSTQYNRLVLNGFGWDTLRPSMDSFNFKSMDMMVDYGGRNNMEIEGHHLTWGAYEHLPAWLVNGNFTRDQLIGILHDHVTTVASRYRGRVKTWTVANEVSDRAHLEHADFWRDNIGPEYVAMAFTWAREADPDAVLLLNEGAAEDSCNALRQQVSDDTYNLISQLKRDNVPIDAVGMQMHILGDPCGDPYNPPRKEDVLTNMYRFASLGVSIYVTEFDVNLTNIPGTHDQRMEFEAGVYRDMLSACMESGVCQAFSTFGFTDAVTWYNSGCLGCLNLPNAEPLPFDRDYQPKPAWYAMRDVLAS